MWPFRKRINKQQERKELITKNQDILKALLACPLPSCLCYDCPSRGKCAVETDLRTSGSCVVEGGPRIMSCSRKKSLKGEFDDVKKENERRKPGTVIAVDSLDDGCLSGFDEVPTVGG